MQTNDTKLKIKSLDQTGLFKGYASVFNVVDAHKEVITSGAFSKSLKTWQNIRNMPKMLWQHDPQKPVGVWLHIEEDDHGLLVTGQILRTLNLGEEAYQLLKSGVIDSLSIGFFPQESHKDNLYQYRHHTHVDLVEISLVTYPANPKAKITHVKSAEEQCLKKCQKLSNLLLSQTHNQEKYD